MTDWAVIASGPSLAFEDVARVERAGWRTIAVNTSYRMIGKPDLLYACDLAWWRMNERNTRLFERWTQDARAAERFGLNRVSCLDAPGMGRGGVIHGGGNSGYQALQLAVLRGARRVLMLGFDCQHTGGLRHWHGDHPAGLNNAGPVDFWRAAFPALADDLAAAGIEVLNASRETALDCFRRVDLADVLERRAA